ncbi:MAG TPA: 2-phospho-L-lactate guanylyltransferase [Solirubrobacteraceae bacterium]|nr:2-phospho-L-lactate guanylyltransferase [Solirubrobacteraceae bacterium]
MSTAAILPMKSFDRAKQRLSTGLGSGHRRALAEAMFADVLVATRRCSSIDRIYVVTGDQNAARIAAGHGATVIDDTASSHSEATRLGISLALAEGIQRALLIPGDCPMLDTDQLEMLLSFPVSERSALIVPDRHGEGTNALLLTPPDALTPAFGEGSRQRHTDLATTQGATPEVVEVPSLALDIDTPEDLELLRETLTATRGGAAHTRGMLAQLERSEQ